MLGSLRFCAEGRACRAPAPARFPSVPTRGLLLRIPDGPLEGGCRGWRRQETLLVDERPANDIGGRISAQKARLLDLQKGVCAVGGRPTPKRQIMIPTILPRGLPRDGIPPAKRRRGPGASRRGDALTVLRPEFIAVLHARAGGPLAGHGSAPAEERNQQVRDALGI